MAKQLLIDCAAAVARLAPDALALAGAAAISYGAALVYEPAGYITGGMLALGLALLVARKQAAQ